jgi:hypothetical protein
MFPLSPRLAIVGSFEGYGNGFELNEESVAMFNGAPISGSTRQVYARDLNFHYALNPGELPRKASHLIRDARFHKRSASREGGDH